MITTQNQQFTHFYKQFTNIFLRVTHFYKHFFESYSFLQTFFCEFQKYNKYGNTYNDKINTMIFVFLFCL